ncbi:hypothetical protein EVAR_13107_1 [Eumeta japonica]|uniref:Uncharacterized protein n=1 Tax=Eumeta variegata TaxID=151549 RepID=A0A4C1U9V5_EUMVA|nr:hypothetical protein EVAR_13107_1 [Eumeta japonica]
MNSYNRRVGDHLNTNAGKHILVKDDDKQTSPIQNARRARVHRAVCACKQSVHFATSRHGGFSLTKAVRTRKRQRTFLSVITHTIHHAIDAMKDRESTRSMDGGGERPLNNKSDRYKFLRRADREVSPQRNAERLCFHFLQASAEHEAVDPRPARPSSCSSVQPLSYMNCKFSIVRSVVHQFFHSVSYSAFSCQNFGIQYFDINAIVYRERPFSRHKTEGYK